MAVDIDDPSYEDIYDIVPETLDDSSSFAGLPVIIEPQPKPIPLQGPGGRGGGGSGGVISGGMKIWGAESGTILSVLKDSQGQHYAVTSSHVLQNSQHVTVGGRTIGRTIIDARPCGKTVYLDCAAALINKGISVSANIQGISGTPKGFAKPTIGMGITQSGADFRQVLLSWWKVRLEG